MKKILFTIITIFILAFYSNAQDSTATKIIVDGRVFGIVGGDNVFDSVILNGATSGQATVQAPAVAGSTTFTLPSTTGILATQDDVDAAQPEGTVILSTSELGGIKFLREDGDNSSSWQEITSASITNGTLITEDLADDAITEPKLASFNAPTDGYHLGYSSVNGLQWEVDAGGSGIPLHPYSDQQIDSIYVGTAQQIADRSMPATVLAFAIDETFALTDLTDVNTSTATNRNFLVADGVDWESRAIVKADLPSVTYREAIAVSDNTTALTTGVKMTWYSPPYAITITDAEASVLTAPTGAELIVDIHDDGVTIMGTDKLDIEVSEFHTKDAVTQPAISAGSIAAGSKLEAEIDQIGSTVAGAGAIVYIYYTID